MPSTPFQRLAVLATVLGLTRAQTYNLQQDLSGNNFFSAFKYNESAVDFNNFGNVHFLSQSAAVNANLTYVDSNGHVIIKVDNTTNGAGDPTFGRNTVYLESNQMMTIGSLLILDANHIPFGCSVWPSLFTQGQVWPQQGEIDIIENVNLETDNRFSLHVGDPNCVQPTSVASNQTGTISTADGDISNCTAKNTVGCVTTETKPNSYGSGFANQGGGVFAMSWDASGIAFWYFARGSIPSNIGGTEAPTPSTWGKASAWYPASGCDPTVAFGPQIITLYIDVCGAFAGVQSLWELNCGSVAPNCSAAVGDPSNYNDAFWDINYLRVYTTGAVNNTSSASGGAAGTGTSSGAGAGATGKSSALRTAAGMRELLLVPASLLLLGLLAL
ncbi:Glycoside hydrolase family 16 protein [Mycena sanguinolenta]|uniref:Glycoside hydrolase family 16 protein n=1 Tax=Mycena sanguinolenta TaxID=230812 RepID=A0A8H6YYF5_9AGAR|nr:Glycoside hydrolase family 16 protein [Mycena sanguinolenta]